MKALMNAMAMCFFLIRAHRSHERSQRTSAVTAIEAQRERKTNAFRNRERVNCHCRCCEQQFHG